MEKCKTTDLLRLYPVCRSTLLLVLSRAHYAPYRIAKKDKREYCWIACPEFYRLLNEDIKKLRIRRKS